MKLESLLGCFRRGGPPTLDEVPVTNTNGRAQGDTLQALPDLRAASPAQAEPKTLSPLQPPAVQPATRVPHTSDLDQCVRAWEHELTDPISFELLSSAVRFQCGHALNAESAAQWLDASTSRGDKCVECGQGVGEPKADLDLRWRAETFETAFPDGYERASDKAKLTFLDIMGSRSPPTELRYQKQQDRAASPQEASESPLLDSESSLLDSFNGPELTRTYDGDPAVRLLGARQLVALLGTTAYPRIRAMAGEDPCPVTRVALKSLLDALDKAARHHASRRAVL